jgi:hypothetical protein
MKILLRFEDIHFLRKETGDLKGASGDEERTFNIKWPYNYKQFNTVKNISINEYTR